MPNIKIVWSESHAKNYKRLYNHLTNQKPAFFKNKNGDTYLNNINNKELIKFIKNLNLSDSSKESIFFMIARYHEYNKTNNTFITNYKQEGYNLKNNREQSDGNNKLDEKEQEGYIRYNELITIINNIKYEDIKTKREHMKYIFLKLLLYNPLRTSFYYTAEFSKGTTEDNKNYIVLFGKVKKMATLHIGNDKVSNTKKYKNNEELKNISINDNNLINLLYDSLNKYPRKYILEIEDGKQLNESYLLKFLREATGNKKNNIDMVRSAYITHHYNKDGGKLNFNEKIKIADNMRHSITTAQLRYYKNLDNEPANKTDENLIKENENLRSNNINLKKELEELKIKLSSYENILNKSKEPSKKDIDADKIKNDPKNLRKARVDYLYKLNTGKQKKPNERLINLYGIRYDKEQNKYI